MRKVKQIAKSIASLVGGIAVAVVAVGVNENWALGLGITAAVATAVVTWAVPNADDEPQHLAH